MSDRAPADATRPFPAPLDPPLGERADGSPGSAPDGSGGQGSRFRPRLPKLNGPRFRRPTWADLKTPPELTARIYLIAVSLVLLGLSLAQQPDKTVIDTKPALALNPSGYLGQQLHLWNTAAEGGSIPNQTIGYLAPIGPYFLLMRALGVPTSIAQHLWMALLLITAFWGVVRLCDALRIGNRTGRILGALAYAVSPWMLSRIGDLSAFVIGGALLPWILLPLVHYTHGSPATAERTSARRAAARSAIGVFLIGGTNASVVLDVLIAPALWLFLMCRGPGAWKLRVWWAGAVGAAILWWVTALLLQARYSINFLPYTETANVTTLVTSLAETIRGTPDWFDYLRSGALTTDSGWTYVTAPVVLVGSLVIAGLGVAGLARARVPARRFWLACLAIGVVAIAAAYPEEPNGILAKTYVHLLTGVLGPLRNVTKFEPLVRLPLAIGVACLLPALMRRPGTERRKWGRTLSTGVALVTTAAIAIAAAPLGLIRIYSNTDFAVPAYWKTAASWLAQNATDTRTLLLPGTAFAEYKWGNPRDEPLLWLGKTDWAVRDLIPFGSVNSTRWLDAIEAQLGQRAAPNLAATLARGGMGYVLVRNDLAPNASDTPPSSDQIHAALASAGLKRIATFGPMERGRASGLETLFNVRDVTKSYPALEVYKVPGATRVSVYPTAETAVISGGPEALTTLSGTPILGNRPTVLAADVAAGKAGQSELPADQQPTTWIDTDTLDRRETSYGSVHDTESYLETAGTRIAVDTSAPQIRFDVDADGHQTVARYEGIKNLTASASGYVLRPDPGSGPGSAVDGDPNTAWQVSGYQNHNVGQWLQVTLNEPRSIPSISVQVRKADYRISALRITTDTGSLVTKLKNVDAPQTLAVPAGPTSKVRLTIAATVGSERKLAGAAIAELKIPGVTINEQVVLPNDWASAYPGTAPKTVSYVFSRERGDPNAPINIDTERQLNRVFTVLRKSTFYAAGTAVARSGEITSPGTGKTVDFSCGSGPNVTIDKQTYQTYVSGSRSALTAGSPISLGICTLKPITLDVGSHTLTTSPGSQRFNIATLTLTNQTRTPPPSARSAKLGKWGLEHRSVTLSGGSSGVLTIHENFSKSWTATVNGKTLPAIQVDGWQQGFVVPAGGDVTVVITNHPSILLRIGLLVGAVTAFLVLLAALIPRRRRVKAARLPTPARSHRLRVVRVTSLVVACATTALVAGPVVAAAVPVMAVVIWLVRRIAPVLVLAAFGTAIGMCISENATYPAAHRGVFSPITQVAIALAIAAVILAAGARGVQEEPVAPPPLEPADALIAGGGEGAREPGDDTAQPAASAADQPFAAARSR